MSVKKEKIAVIKTVAPPNIKTETSTRGYSVIFLDLNAIKMIRLSVKWTFNCVNRILLDNL